MTSPDGITWTSCTSAADNTWNSVTYGNGLFVAVSTTVFGNRVMTSPDGITWTSQTSAADNAWLNVTYGNGLFVAVSATGTGNRVMTSPDGITWTSQTSPANNSWNSVTYANGLFVAVSGTGTGNRVMTSPDGINWTLQNSAAENEWNYVTFGNGLFVAVSRGVTGTGNRVMTSPDGITWTSRTSAADLNWNRVVFANGLFVAVAASGTGNRVMTSPDGITWTTRTSAADNLWNGIAYGNGLFVAVSRDGTGNRVMTSNAAVSRLTIDAIANQTYTGAPLTPAIVVKDDATTLTLGTHYSVAYSNNTNVGTATVTITGMGNYVGTKTATFSIVAKAASSLTIDAIANQTFTGSALTPAIIVKDGATTLTLGTDYTLAYTANTDLGTATVTITGMGNYAGTKTQTFEIVPWTSRTSAADNSWYGVAYGNGVFVAIAYSGTGNRVMTSPDGITWTIRTSAADNGWWEITYANGLFVAVASSGTGNRVMTSPDGITWTIRTSAADYSWRNVAYGNGLYVAVASSGTGNRVMTSPDGITWTARTSAADNNWYNVTYGNGLFVAVSTSGIGNRVMTSPDGITWTIRTSAADNNWGGLAYGNGLFVSVATSGTGNRVMTSPDGITWTARTSAEDNNWYSLTYGNGLFVAVSDNGTNRVMTSPDGITWTAQKSIVNNAWYGLAYGNGLFVAVSGSGTGNRVMTLNAAVSRLTIDAIADQSYTGSPLTPAIVVKDGPTTLTLGTHYSVAYSNNTNVGTATVTITGMGSYIGTKTATFSIVVPPTTITSFSPASGPVGTLVTITGTNLGTPTAFTIGGTAAIVISNTGTSLVGMVMPGAVTGTISLTTAGGSVSSTGTFTLSVAPTPNTQQGAKLVGTGNTGAANQGYIVSISADGNTAIVGGDTDNSSQGAAWIYTRSGATWSQQGAKLVGTGAVGNAQQGVAVSLSADGNTAIMGGYADNSFQGAAWIFTRSGTTWSQQGDKLVGTGNTGAARQGRAVSISADGNTAIVSGNRDNSDQGAAWIFTRSGTTWTQQGAKLVGTGNTGAAQQGRAVSLSADGNTAIVGGNRDNSDQGAAWIFTRSDTTWTQQGVKLVGTGNTGAARQGAAVSLSADGTTAILGGNLDNTNQGAAWIFTRSGATWTQQGAKLVGTGNTGAAEQGVAVSISADGTTAILGGNLDNTNQGAAWVFTRSGTTWSQRGDKLVGTGAVGNAQQGYAVSISADGTTAILGGYADNSIQGAAWVYTYVPPPPTITSATYNASTGVLVVTGTNLVAIAGATNDIDVSKLSLTGEGGSSYTLTTSNVELTNATSFSITLNATDKTSINALLNKIGTSSIGGTTYNLAAAEDWNAGADPAVVLADLTGNGITVSDLATITTTGTLAALTTIYATASSNTSFSVSGVSLTNDIIVTAPSGFEVSVSPTSGFGNTVTLTQTSGTVSITTVYVRLKSNSSVVGSPYSGDVTCTSTNAQTVNVATVSSTVTALGLTITGVTASNKEYDANLTATLGGTATLVGVVTADQANVTLAGTATATFNNASVGTNKAVTVTGYTLGGTAAGNYTVSQPTGLTANITAKAASSLTIDPIANQTYTGSALTPAIVVKDGTTTLTLGTDYTVAYSNNTNVGTATVTITGMDIYTGTKTQTFSIVSKAVSTLTIEPIANQTYTGSALTPAIVVKDGATTLTLGTDYTVAYSDNTNLGTATVTITGMGIYTGTKTQTFSIVNVAPTNIATSVSSVNENNAAGASIATLSATDSNIGETFTYTLVAGTGDTDNARFSISGSSLSAVGSFNYETKTSYSVRIKVTDAGGLSFEKALTIAVTNVNEAPTNITANATSVAENAASGTSVGTLAGTDEDAGDTFTFALVAGTGSADNASFTLDGSTLKTTTAFDFETKNSYAVRIKVTDAGGLSFEKALSITITDVNETPSAMAITKSNLYESNTINQVVGALSTSDQDAGDSHTYSLVSGTGSTDNAAFNVSGNQIRASQAFSSATKNSYSIRVRTTDKGGLSFEKVYTVSISQLPTLTGTGNEYGTQIQAVASATPKISKGLTSKLNVSGIDMASFNWSPSASLSSANIYNPVAQPSQTQSYSVTVTNVYGSSTTLSITVEVMEDWNIVPNNILTPNGDGVNDNWVIENLSSYPNNQLIILDRSNVLIYKKSGYANDWTGLFNGAPLPSGTYYYVLTFDSPSGQKVSKRGFITITK